MRKIFVLLSIIGIAFYSCKKDPKTNVAAQVTGTWSLSSFANSLNPQTPIATAADYPCVSNNKLIFKSDGDLVLPPFDKCYISAQDAFGNGSSISRDAGVSGSWTSSGSSVYTTVFDSTTRLTYKQRYDVSTSNGQLQLKSVDTLLSGTLIFLYVKQ